MTTSGRSRGTGLTPRRRSLLLGGIGGASTAALATLGHTGTAAASQATGAAAQQQPAQSPFDFDNGNFIRDLRGEDAEGASSSVAPNDVTIVIRDNVMMNLAWFDAMAPYHPTAVGVYTRIPRRPASESETNRNLNIAGLYATYRVAQGAFQDERATGLGAALTAFGLDPEDTSEDPTTAVGIGNLAGKGIVAARQRDGMNTLGDEGRKYNGQPYADYTGYRPMNTAFELTHPSRWQPHLGTHNRRQGGGAGDKGIFTVQQFCTPQMRLVEPYTFSDPSEFRIAPPRHCDHHRSSAYRRAVDEVLAASASLTDEQKVKAEFFDNMLLGMRLSAYAGADAHDPESDRLDMFEWVQLFLTHSVAQHDALVAVWHNKAKYDSVRPFSAIRHVYGGSPVTAWGGVGMGTVENLRAEEWASYLKVADHPEYPSGYVAIAAAEAQGTRRIFGDDTLGLTRTVAAGSAVVEKGMTPASELELRWDTWTDFVRDCADSRLWGGVHFAETVERSIPFGEQFGDLGYEFVQRHVNGEAD